MCYPPCKKKRISNIHEIIAVQSSYNRPVIKEILHMWLPHAKTTFYCYAILNHIP